MHAGRDDRFARVPLEFMFALERGEISFDQWALGAYLVGKVDFRRNEASATLRSLADQIGWGKSSESLRLALNALRDGGWIRFQSGQGKRSPYVFSLARLQQNGRQADEDETSYNDSSYDEAWLGSDRQA